MTPGKKLSAALAAAMMMQAASAQAACWNDDQAAAAKVREMETMLMVGSLRCRAQDQRLLGQYNAFIKGSRPALVLANDRLRAHFTTAGSGLNGYDRYVTSLANRYGGGTEGLSCHQLSIALQAVTSRSQTLASLSELADAMDVRPGLPGGRCTVQVARR